jgi:hypothetical protein
MLPSKRRLSGAMQERMMIAPVEIPYVVPPDASEHCRDLVIAILAALGMSTHDDRETQDRLVALVAVLAGEIERGGNPDGAKARLAVVRELLFSIVPENVEQARRIREADKSKN